MGSLWRETASCSPRKSAPHSTGTTSPSVVQTFVREGRTTSNTLPRPAPHVRHHPAIGGVHPKFVQELLGHATKAITLDTYSHVLRWETTRAGRWRTPCRKL